MYVTGFTTYATLSDAVAAFSRKTGPAALTILPDSFVVDDLAAKPIYEGQLRRAENPKTLFNTDAQLLYAAEAEETKAAANDAAIDKRRDDFRSSGSGW